MPRQKIFPTDRLPPPRKLRRLHACLLMGVPLLLTSLILTEAWPDITAQASSGNRITCSDPYITDGDTLRCDGYRIRLAGIDAPEMPGHCRTGRKCTKGDPLASRDYLKSVSRGTITCAAIEQDHYGRTVARCQSEGGNDLSCAMIKSGHAVKRYGRFSCSGNA